MYHEGSNANAAPAVEPNGTASSGIGASGSAAIASSASSSSEIISRSTTDSFIPGTIDRCLLHQVSDTSCNKSGQLGDCSGYSEDSLGILYVEMFDHPTIDGDHTLASGTGIVEGGDHALGEVDLVG